MEYDTISEAWHGCIRECMEKGYDYEIGRGSYEGQIRRQLRYLTVRIRHPEKRPLACDRSGTFFSTDETIDDYYRKNLINPDPPEHFAYTYGERIGWASGIEGIADMLRDSPGTNQAVMSVSRPEDIELDDPPCLRSLSWKVTPDGLQLCSYWRSWDLVCGLPENLGGLQLLNEAVSELAGLQCGPQLAFSDGAHVYDHFFVMFGKEKKG
jgi:thymidylate synthase